jgi:YggT family protein
MRALLQVLDVALAIYIWLLVAVMVLYWLISFGAIDAHRRAVTVIHAWLWWFAAPLLRPIRSMLPEFGGVDVSPLVAVLALMAVRYGIALYVLHKLLP